MTTVVCLKLCASLKEATRKVSLAVVNFHSWPPADTLRKHWPWLISLGSLVS